MLGRLGFVGCVLFIVLFGLACKTQKVEDGGKIDVESQTGEISETDLGETRGWLKGGEVDAVESGARLPDMRGGLKDCTGEEYELGLKEWIQASEGVLFGTVERVEPALDLGWVDLNNYDGKRLRTVDECEEVTGAFVVHLKDVRGYLHDQEVPEKLALYVGFAHRHLWSPGPEISAEGVVWPEGEKKIEAGMRIGGLLTYNEGIERWGVDLGGEERLFQVLDDRLQAQKLVSGNYCGAVAPVSLIETMSEADLMAQMSELNANNGLYMPVSKRMWSSAGAPDGDVVGGGNWLGAGNWLGRCVVE